MKKNVAKTALLIIGIFILTIGGGIGVALLTENKDNSSENTTNKRVGEPIKEEEKQEDDQNIKTDNVDNDISKIKCLVKTDFTDSTITMENWNLSYNTNTNKLTKVTQIITLQLNISDTNNPQLLKEAENLLMDYYNGRLEAVKKMENELKSVKGEVKYDKSKYSVSTSTIIDMENVSYEYLETLLGAGGPITNHVDNNLIFDSVGFLDYTNNNGFVCSKE